MRRAHIDKVTPGSKLGKTIYGDNYEVLLKQGVTLGEGYIKQLINRGFMRVYIDDEETADIVFREPISDQTRIMATKDIIKTYKVTYDSALNMDVGATESVISGINSPRIRKSFHGGMAFKQLCDDVNFFLDEIIGLDVLSVPGMMKSFDNYRYEHSIDAAVVSLLIAKKLNLSRDKMEMLAIGQMLHDIGMSFIDKKITNKPGKLTPEEFNIIKLHTVYGYELLKDAGKSGAVSCAHIPYQHHEWQNGGGYPRSLKGTNKVEMSSIAYVEEDKMVMFSEIVAIADFYDGCISDRPYRKGLPPDLAYDIIKSGAGMQFNKELVDCFLSVVPKYPVGYDVKIKGGVYNGFTGVVASINSHQLSKPKVLVLSDEKNKKIEPFEFDVSSRSAYADLECIY